ncbi:MAG: hypothetical protein JXR95_01895 [Deltaproteobacteria bacterium]|nr:hypothetical protein [Deltaproteobacteria bacterium]
MENLGISEMKNLITRVFSLKGTEKTLAVLTDLPPDAEADDNKWKSQRLMASDWVETLRDAFPNMEISHVVYKSPGKNNGDLPVKCGVNIGLPSYWSSESDNDTFENIFNKVEIILAPTRYSTTAPLKMASTKYNFRAATMPGFSMEMADALRVDYSIISARVEFLKEMLDKADGALISFSSSGESWKFHLDLRFRKGHASGGTFNAGPAAGNLPSGEAYIVPYEGEIANEPSFTRGLLPVQFGDEIVVYRVEGNKAVEVITKGEMSEIEDSQIKNEVAYANIAELGLGVLGDFGIKPVGEILLDEKLGLHIAFGRSDHFGGQVGVKDFSSPEQVIHIDRVYIPETQPLINIDYLVLENMDGSETTLMENGKYTINFPV